MRSAALTVSKFKLRVAGLDTFPSSDINSSTIHDSPTDIQQAV